MHVCEKATRIGGFMREVECDVYGLNERHK